MQQMNSDAQGGNPQRSYGAYEGEASYYDPFERPPGQKLGVDEDEQYATSLARKIKKELRDEARLNAHNASMTPRLLLGLGSLLATVALFGLLVLALALGVVGDALLALGWGAVAAFGVIFAINGYFNWANIEIEKSRSKSELDDKAKSESH